MEKDDIHSESNEEVGSESEDDILLLEAVNKMQNTIVKRSLKRTRGMSKLPKKKKMRITRDRRQGTQVVEKDNSIPKRRYNASYLIEVMKAIDDDQRNILRDIEFGALLDPDGGFVPWSFVQWLADHVDAQNEDMILGKSFIELNIQSFGHVLGIPTNGASVPPEIKATTLEFLLLFGLTEMPSIKFFGDKIIRKQCKDSDEFLRCFMTVALACFYYTTSSTKRSTTYLGALIGFNKIKTFNWGKFVQELKNFYIKKYHASSSTLAICNYYFAFSNGGFDT